MSTRVCLNLPSLFTPYEVISTSLMSFDSSQPHRTPESASYSLAYHTPTSLPRNQSTDGSLATPASPTSPSVLASTQNTLSPSQSKRRKENDGFITYSPDQPSAPRKKKRVGLSPLQKLESILNHIQSLDWSFSDYMFYSSEWKHVKRGNAHSKAMEKFLSGRCQHHPGEIIKNWYTSPDGRLGNNDLAASQMWSSSEPKYYQINHIRACLTSFAAQTCIAHAVQQAKTAVKPTNGLHVRLSAKGDSGVRTNSLRTDWDDISNNTVSRVGDIIRRHEPFLYDLLSCIASGKTSFDGTVVQKTRPIDIVVTHSIAALNFTLNRYANWLPVIRAILYFSTSAPVDLFAYESRTGTMPAYSTIYAILRDLGMEEGRATQVAGANPNLWGKVFFDNTQRYLRQRDMRFGRENKMSIGIAGTFIEYAEGTFPPAAPDIQDKKARLAQNERANIDVKYFIKLINQKHLETVGTLQWLDTLVTHIPELAHYKENINKLYETDAAINRLPPTASKIHCLSTVAKNENVTGDLYSTILNFFEQIGQTKESHIPRVWPFGGDGLTYQRLLELRRYVQFNKNISDLKEFLPPVFAHLR
ncbi:hypothetical protein C8R42DRAFT_4930 [Lentinula raphanica]|nr:hypothetical protein C8R42DRAFT_4930 [Lentinula raphanica]